MNSEEARRLIIECLESDAPVYIAEDLARVYDVVLTEVWENDEIIGMMVDDITIYY